MPNTVEVDRLALTAATLRAAGCVFAEDEAALLLDHAATPTELATLVQRRVIGEPLEVILGWAQFCGLRIAVDPGVFVPRQRTEFLAQRAIQCTPPAAIVVDLCCGTGAIGIAVAAAVPGIKLHAVDIEPAAVRCAERNLKPVAGQVHRGDLYEPLPPSLRGRIDVLVVNAPYVPSEQLEYLPSEARDYEPLIALDGGPDGVAVHRRVAAAAAAWLSRDGRMLVETSRGQAPLTAAAMARHGLQPEIEVSDELSATVVSGTVR